ncbi:MAG: tRNA preQ1(34) S-adenosylmethionine ribosyltransferase-isomerase QueA [Candidatus Manganitrophaceae bacterium]
MFLDYEQLLATYDYSLDPSLIAAEPLAERDHSRLLIYDREKGQIDHRHFFSLPDHLHSTDLLILNDSRVFPARLRARKESARKELARKELGGSIDLLLLRPSVDGMTWEVLVKGKAGVSSRLHLTGGGIGQVIREGEGGWKEIRFDIPTEYPNMISYLDRWGETPLPPYILKRRSGAERPGEPLERERYQTVYARVSGSVAAPTAGLHFTDSLLETIRRKGVAVATVTLHVGLGTFQPMRDERIDNHRMHREWFRIPEETAEAVRAARRRGGRVIAVGTTVTRALESVSSPDGTVKAGEGETDLFIRPGYRFNVVDGLVTNFHLPKSTLLVLVSAFAGGEAIRSVYREAIRERYRFYSYGDAMLLL